MDNRQRVENADRTSTLLAALKMLETTDFTTMMGSGIMVKLTPITDGKHLADEFALPAEDMETIKAGMIASLQAVLRRRRASLLSEVKKIETAVSFEM
jgi:hypothetical protein